MPDPQDISVSTTPQQFDTQSAAVQGELQPPSGPVAPPVQQMNTPQAQEAVHTSVIGKVAKALLGNHGYDYQIDPQTGQTIKTPIQEKPGQIFRNIVAGAILGGMAGGKEGGGLLQGFATGGRAEIEDSRNQDQLRLNRAQEQYKNQQTAQERDLKQRQVSVEENRLNQEKIRDQATVAHWDKEMVMQERDFNLRTEDHLDTVNHWNEDLKDKYESAGGILAPWTENDKIGNGDNLVKAVNSGDDKLQPPAGYTRRSAVTVDTSGLHHDADKGWVDDKDQHVDLKDRTKVSVYFTPEASSKQVTNVSGSQLMKNFPHIYGKSLDPKRQYPVSLGDYQGLATKESEIARIESNDRLKIDHENLMVAYDAAKVERDDLRSELVGLDPYDPRRTEIMSKLDTANQRMQTVAGQMNPYYGKVQRAEAAKSAEQDKALAGGSTEAPTPEVPQIGPDGKPLPKPTEGEGGLAKIVGKAVANVKAHFSKENEGLTVRQALGIDKLEMPVSVAQRRAAENRMTYPQYKSEMEKEGWTITADKTNPIPTALSGDVGKRLISILDGYPKDQRKSLIESSTSVTASQKTALKQYYGIT